MMNEAARRRRTCSAACTVDAINSGEEQKLVALSDVALANRGDLRSSRKQKTLGHARVFSDLVSIHQFYFLAESTRPFVTHDVPILYQPLSVQKRLDKNDKSHIASILGSTRRRHLSKRAS